MYGFRVGAIFSFIKDENLKNDFADALESQIRGTYSSPNGPAINSLAQALNSNDIEKLSN